MGAKCFNGNHGLDLIDGVPIRGKTEASLEGAGDSNTFWGDIKLPRKVLARVTFERPPKRSTSTVPSRRCLQGIPFLLVPNTIEEKSLPRNNFFLPTFHDTLFDVEHAHVPFTTCEAADYDDGAVCIHETGLHEPGN